MTTLEMYHHTSLTYMGEIPFYSILHYLHWFFTCIQKLQSFFSYNLYRYFTQQCKVYVDTFTASFGHAFNQIAVQTLEMT